MKKIITSMALILMLSGLTIAGNSSLFSYDKSELETEFAEIQLLEDMVLSNHDLTINDFQNMEIAWLDNVDLEVMKSTSPVNAMFSIDDMDWGAFAWGFCCCPVGFFVVAIDDSASQDSKTSYWVGVIVNAVLSAVSTLASSGTSYAVY